MKNFGKVIDNFDAVTKQYVDNKVPTDEHIKGIKVDNATLADTAKKVQNAFTYKAHNKAAGTVVPITYDGSKAASLDFSADDFAYDYSSGKDLGLKLVDKGYATKTYVDNNAGLSSSEVNSAISTYIDNNSITAETLRGRMVSLLASDRFPIGSIELIYTTTGYGMGITTTYGGFSGESAGNVDLESSSGGFIALRNFVSLGGGPLILGSAMYGTSLPNNPQYGQVYLRRQ